MKDGEVSELMYCILPSWVLPTAAHGEHWAAKMALRYAGENAEIITDCQSVVASVVRGRQYALHHRRTTAGVWLHAPWQQAQVRKTKAHRTREQAGQEDEVADFEGNHKVDQLAKLAAWGAVGQSAAEGHLLEAKYRARFWHGGGANSGKLEAVPTEPGEAAPGAQECWR